MKITRRVFIKRTIGIGDSLFIPTAILGAAREKEKQRIPAYALLEREGVLASRIEETYANFGECRLCPRECGVNRLNGEKGNL